MPVQAKAVDAQRNIFGQFFAFKYETCPRYDFDCAV